MNQLNSSADNFTILCCIKIRASLKSGDCSLFINRNISCGAKDWTINQWHYYIINDMNAVATCPDYLSAQASGRADTSLPDTVRGSEVPDLPEAPGDWPRDLPGLLLCVRVWVWEDWDIVTVSAAQGDTGDLGNKAGTGLVTGHGGQGRVERAQSPVILVTRPQALAPPPCHVSGVTPRDKLVQQLLGVHDNLGVGTDNTETISHRSHYRSWLTPVWQMSRSRLLPTPATRNTGHSQMVGVRAFSKVLHNAFQQL